MLTAVVVGETRKIIRSSLEECHKRSLYFTTDELCSTYTHVLAKTYTDSTGHAEGSKTMKEEMEIAITAVLAAGEGGS